MHGCMDRNYCFDFENESKPKYKNYEKTDVVKIINIQNTTILTRYFNGLIYQYIFIYYVIKSYNYKGI